MKLIDKDKVVEKINSVLDSFDPNEITSGRYELVNLRDFIDTLEVKKEVDLDESARHYLLHEHISPLNEVLHQADLKVEMQYHKDIEDAYKAGFELGLSAQTSTVWHYVSEEIPTKFGNPIIVASKNKNKEDGIWLYDLIQSWEGEWNPRVNWENPVKWVYMDDLLKQKKGE